MKINKKIILGLTILSGLITTFSVKADCTLLSTWGGITLGEGKSITGRSIPEATYTQSCDSSMGIITCNNGVLSPNANTYKYPSCTPHTWRDCITPVIAKHLQLGTLYKADTATFYQTCNQLSKAFQCIDYSFTGNDVSIYKYGQCIQPQWRQCEDIWKNDFKNHLDKIISYKTDTSTSTATCAQNRIDLECIDGTWSGGNQSSLFPNCTDISNLSCIFTGSDNSMIQIPSGSGKYLFSSPISVYPKTCQQSSGYISCNNGIILGNWGYFGYETCVDGSDKTCYFTGIDTAGLDKQFAIQNLTTGIFYKDYVSSFPDNCKSISAELYCNNGTIIGDTTTYRASYCYNGSSKNCSFTGKDINGKDKLFTVYAGTTGTFYQSFISNYPETCKSKPYFCDDGHLVGYDEAYQANYCTNGTPEDCLFTGKDSRGLDKIFTIRNGSKKSFYQLGDAPDGGFCSSGEIACNNGELVGSTTYKYESCIDNCDLSSLNLGFATNFINHYSGSNGNTGFDIFSQKIVVYPETCDSNKTRLSCDNGRVIGDYKAFPYDTCSEDGGLEDGIDLRLNISSQGGVTKEGTIQVAQFSSPAVNMTIKNRGKYIVSGSNIAAGFLSCDWKVDATNKINIYKSKLINQFVLNSATSLRKSITFNNVFTQSLGVKEVECTLDPNKNRGAGGVDVKKENNVWSGKFDIMTAERFDISMNRAIDSIRDNLDSPEIGKGAQGINNFLITKVMNVLVPLIIVLGILIAILGFYKLLFSDDDKAIGEGIKYITYGVVGIIVIMSAKFITNTIYNDIFQAGILGYGDVQGYEMAQKVYENLAFPFIKLAIYLALGVLFVILASRVLTFIFGSDDDSKKKAGTIIAWNSIGMLVIIAAKQVVEFVYGKQASVVKAVSNLGEIGSGILANKNLPILYQVINWAMGLASLVILIMILIEAFKLLTKPDSPDAMKGIKNTLLYIVIGIIIIGTGYLVTNFLIIN